MASYAHETDSQYDPHADPNFGDPTSGSTAYVGLVGTIIFVLVVIYLEALFYETKEAQRVEKVVDQRSVMLEAHRVEQETLLNTYRYDHMYNENKGRVTIPLDEARAKLIQEWNAGN